MVEFQDDGTKIGHNGMYKMINMWRKKYTKHFGIRDTEVYRKILAWDNISVPQDTSEYDKYVKFIDESYLRYMPGYRHYESFYHYQLKNSKATIEEYHHDMNREVTFEEFFQMFASHIRLAVEHNAAYKHQLQEINPDTQHIENFLASNELRYVLR